MMRFTVATMCLSVMLTPTCLLADEPDSDLPEWAEERVEPFRARIGNWVDNTSRNIDAFFGGDDSATVRNDSYLRLGQELDWMEGDGTSGDISLRYRIDLPTTEDRLRLIIESDPEESQGTLADQGSGRLYNDQRDRSTSTFGLDWLERRDKRENWSNRIGAGIRLRMPLDPYVRFTSERLWDIGDGPGNLNPLTASPGSTTKATQHVPPGTSVAPWPTISTCVSSARCSGGKKKIRWNLVK